MSESAAPTDATPARPVRGTTPYLNFDGNAREAMTFYHRASAARWR